MTHLATAKTWPKIGMIYTPMTQETSILPIYPICNVNLKYQLAMYSYNYTSPYLILELHCVSRVRNPAVSTVKSPCCSAAPRCTDYAKPHNQSRRNRPACSNLILTRTGYPKNPVHHASLSFSPIKRTRFNLKCSRYSWTDPYHIAGYICHHSNPFFLLQNTTQSTRTTPDCPVWIFVM